MKKKIAIALSGGVDSLVAAHLLQERGYDVIGIHFLTGFERPQKSHRDTGSHPVASLGEQLGIPVHFLDCSKEFKDTVIKYFFNIYQSGQTPNPCMVCNPTIKFGTVLNYALQLGASYLASGHYASVKHDKTRTARLFRGKDKHKDQAYFLALLTQQQLAAAKFPVGDLTKSSVREIANKNGLTPVTSDESQDICFIRDKNYKVFLSDTLGLDEIPGPILDMRGNAIGQHHGLHRYTVGQRRGINIPSSEPYYVVKIDSRQNRLIVGYKKDLVCSEFKVRDINWIGQSPTNQISLKTRVRYRSQAYETMVIPIDKKTAYVKFKTPQSAVAPGQAAVFYKDDEVLGGGWILPS